MSLIISAHVIYLVMFQLTDCLTSVRRVNRTDAITLLSTFGVSTNRYTFTSCQNLIFIFICLKKKYYNILVIIHGLNQSFRLNVHQGKL